MRTATMPVLAPETAEEIIAGWLTGSPIDGSDDPAGPLFPGSEYAVQEITMTGWPGTRCSGCSGSAPRIVCC